MSTEALILIVEDHMNDLRLLSSILHNHHYDIMVAQTGRRTLEKLDCVRPDLILLDVILPDISGFDLCRQIKANPATATIPLIFLTALTDIEDKALGFHLGAVDYITKPFQQVEVMGRIQLHLHLQRLTSDLQRKNEQLLKEIQIREEAEHRLQMLTLNLEQQIMQRTEALRETITHLQEQEHQLLHEATHDALTGLYNRTYLIQSLETLLCRPHAHGAPYAILFVDLDHFKGVNDRLGHGTGDELLRQVAQRLRRLVGDRGIVGRLGGDEFLIILGSELTQTTIYFTGEPEANADPSLRRTGPPLAHGGPQPEIAPSPAVPTLQEWTQADLLPFVKMLLRQLHQPFQLESYVVTVGGSVGIVTQHLGYTDVKSILRDVDLAMYQAKRKGRGGYVLLDVISQQQALDRLTLEAELQQVLPRGELRVYYQPIINLKTLELAGFEALVRWQHPQRGLLLPGLFIQVCEEMGLIQDIDFWVLETACQQFRQWQQDYPQVANLFLNLNLSPYQLQDEGLSQHLKAICDRWQFPPRSLKLEITESLFQHAPEQLQRILLNIQALGTQLCIDDFGTGYSSLSRLQTLPVTTLKIDRSFVQQLETEPGQLQPTAQRYGADGEAIAAPINQAAIVQAILALAQGFNLETVAEGIETAGQLQQLQALGCNYGQGFFFGPPLPVEEVVPLLTRTACMCSQPHLESACD